MSVNKDEFIRPAVTGGMSHLLRSQKEGITQTHKRGAPLVYSSGYLIEATSAAVVDVAGFANKNGNNNVAAGDADAEYFPTELCNSFKGKLSGATASHTLAQTDLGATYGLAKNSDGTWFVDAEEGTAGHQSVTVTELLDAIGTVDGWVKFSLNLYGNPYVD